ncbi:uncharacterized protein [Nicotiana sylvestris]|uniref:uncharacterized protein n=1 Tax=Nicotiana sylvestris TaxID=4096 RepID=UPI00388C5B4F
MAALPNFEEGQSTYKPPRFNGQYYGWWKTRMHDFIVAKESEMWEVICDGPHVPMKKLGESGPMVPKTRKDYSDIDRKPIKKNFCAKKILEAFQIVHEGTTQVKQSKIYMLTTECELFRMKDDNSIQDMHTKFTSIINELHSLGEIIPRNKLVRKVLSVLPSSWESKVNAISEAKDFQTLTIEELIGNLKTYKMKIKKDIERREPNKEKNLVLKAKNNDSSEEDSDMAYLTKRFQKMVRRNGGIPKRGSSSKPRNYDLCHKCGKPSQKRATDNVVKQALAAWGDSSNESEEEPDAGNNSMMAVENEGKEYDSLFALIAQSDDDEEDDNDEEAIENLSKEKNTLGEKIAAIEQERDGFLVIITDLEETIEGLKSEHRLVSIEKGKEVASETHIKLEKELNDVKTSLCGKLKKNRQLQAELEKVGIGFQKEKTPYTLTSSMSLFLITGFVPIVGTMGTSKKIGTMRGSGLQWIMDSGCSKHMTENTMDFLSLKALQRGNVSFGNGKRGNKVEFLSKVCTVTNLVTGEVVLVAKRYKNIYVADFDSLQAGDMSCLKAVDNDAELWHRRLGGGKKYIFVIVDDYSRFTWALFLRTKDETFEVFVAFVKKIQVKMELKGISDVSNGKADMMSQMKEAGEDNTRSKTRNYLAFSVFLSQIEPKNIKEALKDADWITTIQEELHQFERNNVWHLVPRPSNRTIIGTRWIFTNKLDEHGNFTRNKARLVVQGNNQEEGIDYDETFAPISCMEAIRILIAFASLMEFTLFQMDVKSVFLNGFLKEEVYIKQPPGFECHVHPELVFKLDKALYGLKQAPRAWYERLSKFLLENGFIRGKIDNTLFLKKRGRNLLIVQVYMDDIIFGATTDSLCEEFAKLMGSEFEMSMMGELNFFLGLQVKQYIKETCISQQKYIKEFLKRFDMEASKVIDTPIATATKLDMDDSGSPINQTMLQKKEELEAALQKSKRSNKKKKKRLMKQGEVVADRHIPVV